MTSTSHWVGLQMLGLVGIFFWALALIDCVRNEPDEQAWLWIILVGNVPAAIVFLIFRTVPRFRSEGLHVLGLGHSQQALAKAEEAAREIDGAYQWCELGRLRVESRQWDRAAEAFAKALQRDGKNLEAKWGLAQAEMGREQWQPARALLTEVITENPEFNFGEAKLAFARTCARLGEDANAEETLRAYLIKWNEPEAHYLFAELLAKQGANAEAKQHLQKLISHVKTSAPFQRIKKHQWVSKAKMLLRRVS